MTRHYFNKRGIRSTRSKRHNRCDLIERKCRKQSWWGLQDVSTYTTIISWSGRNRSTSFVEIASCHLPHLTWNTKDLKDAFWSVQRHSAFLQRENAEILHALTEWNKFRTNYSLYYAGWDAQAEQLAKKTVKCPYLLLHPTTQKQRKPTDLETRWLGRDVHLAARYSDILSVFPAVWWSRRAKCQFRGQELPAIEAEQKWAEITLMERSLYSSSAHAREGEQTQQKLSSVVPCHRSDNPRPNDMFWCVMIRICTAGLVIWFDLM